MPHRGRCRCGGTAFESDGEAIEALDHNRALCRRRGGSRAFFPHEAMRPSTETGDDATYRVHDGRIDRHVRPTYGTGAEIVAIDGAKR